MPGTIWKVHMIENTFKKKHKPTSGNATAHSCVPEGKGVWQMCYFEEKLQEEMQEGCWEIPKTDKTYILPNNSV